MTKNKSASNNFDLGKKKKSSQVKQCNNYSHDPERRNTLAQENRPFGYWTVSIISKMIGNLNYSYYNNQNC